MAIDLSTNNYLISMLLGMYQRGELILSPKFQRRSVWNQGAKSFLIDTLLRGFPVPPIHLRLTRLPGNTASSFEVIDGQQRLRTVFEFVSGEFRLNRSTFDATWSRAIFSELSPAHQDHLLDRNIHAFQYNSMSDRDVLEIFERFNVHSTPLNAQELRNGRYFGAFKQTCYQLSRQYLEFWTGSKIFSDRHIARMLEVEFASELLILMMSGFQDKKKSISEYYERFDESWLDRESFEKRFDANILAIASIFGSDLQSTSFTRRPLFYTLFSVVDHYQHGVPGVTLATKRIPLDGDDAVKLRDSVAYWSGVLADNSGGVDEYDDGDTAADVKAVAIREDEGEESDEADSHTLAESEFIRASSSQTDNVSPRRNRFQAVYERAFGGYSQ